MEVGKKMFRNRKREVNTKNTKTFCLNLSNEDAAKLEELTKRAWATKTGYIRKLIFEEWMRQFGESEFLKRKES
jgi:hypothetical protein